MRILYFSVIFEYRGSQTYYTSEINSFIKNDTNVEFIVYSVNCEKNCIIRYNKNVLWVQRKKLKNINTMILFLKDMVKIFTKFKPDIIHSAYVIESIIMGIIGKIFRIPSIFHGRGTDINYLPFISFKNYILAKIACKLNNKILTVSKAMKHDIIKLNVPIKKITHIYNGIDFLKFNPKPKSKKDFKSRRFEIYNIGQYVSIKSHKLMIKTCTELKNNNINFHLTLTGFGPLEKQIKNLIKKNNLENYITLTGYIDHDKTIEFFQKADLYIQPSLTEGMPNSVLEAMSMKLPVILTNAGGMLELIKEPGGILIEKNNEKQLYNAVIHYIQNPQNIEIAGKINREFILKNFNWEEHTEKLYNIYLNLIKK